MKPGFSLLLWWIIFILHAKSAQAQPEPENGQIRGIVTDAESREQLPSAHISVFPVNHWVTSTESGNFELNNLESGSYILQITYLGYETFESDTIHLEPGESRFIQVEMNRVYLETSEIVVTATRKSQTLVSTPVSLEVVKAKEIRDQNMLTFDQVFDGMSGVQITRSGNANVQALSIRGASEVAGGGTGNRIMLLIDGRPSLSPDSGGALWNLVPVNSIEKVEVVKGAYSALFGSSAMGGVINVITKKPGSQPETHLHLNYGFYNKAPKFTGYDLFNDYTTIELSHSNRKGPLSYVFDFSKKSNDGHREKSGFDLLNTFFKAEYSFKPNKQITFSGNVNRMDNDTPATWISRTRAYSVAEHRVDDFQSRDEYSVDISYSNIPTPKLKQSARLYYYHNFSEFTFDEDPGNDSTNVNIGTSQIVDRETINSQRIGGNLQLDMQEGNSHFLLTGLDFNLDKVVALPDSVLYGRHHSLNLGLYIQDEISLDDRLKLTIGSRLDYYNIFGDFTEWNFSPKLAFVFDPVEKVTLRMLFAQAFRNPAIAERFIKFEQGGGLYFEPNPDLKSEKLLFSFELGNRLRLGSGTYIDLAYFYNYYENLISFQQIPNPQNQFLFKVVNLKKATMQGLELNFHYRRYGFFQIHAGYTFLEARDRSDNRLNDELAYKIRHSFHFTTTLNAHLVQLNLTGRYKSGIQEVFIYPGSEPRQNFVFNGTLTKDINDQLTTYFSIKNVFDVQYEELERYRMPGRSFTLGARFQMQ